MQKFTTLKKDTAYNVFTKQTERDKNQLRSVYPRESRAQQNNDETHWEIKVFFLCVHPFYVYCRWELESHPLQNTFKINSFQLTEIIQKQLEKEIQLSVLPIRPIFMPERARALRADWAPGPGVLVLFPPVARSFTCMAVIPSSCYIIGLKIINIQTHNNTIKTNKTRTVCWPCNVEQHLELQA